MRSATILTSLAALLTTAAAHAQQQFATADELLVALETAGEDIERLSADITFHKEFILEGDEELRQGSLGFVVDNPSAEQPLRRFAITFNKLRIGDRIENDQQSYIFDGRWLVERHERDKQFIKREIVGPNEQWDPLELGEGPFPVPIGQQRDAILAEYDAALAPTPDAGLPDHFRVLSRIATDRDYVQLVLTPRAELADDADYDEVRLWYDRDQLLPRLVRTVSYTGDVTTVRLEGVAMNDNAQITDEQLSTDAPTDAGWAVSVEYLRLEPDAVAGEAPPPDAGGNP